MKGSTCAAEADGKGSNAVIEEAKRFSFVVRRRHRVSKSSFYTPAQRVATEEDGRLGSAFF